MQVTRLDRRLRPKKVISWALYDCANSAFATTVMAGLFPVFFKQFWGAGLDTSVSTYHLGQANSIAAIIGGCVAPFLGYLADRKAARKRLLFFFAAAGIVTTAPSVSCLTELGRGAHFLCHCDARFCRRQSFL